VLEVRGDAVRLGIQAPRSVSVHREEVYVELQRANQQAAESATGATDATVAAVARGWLPDQRDAAGPDRPAETGTDLK
jgi:carbon storage regulator